MKLQYLLLIFMINKLTLFKHWEFYAIPCVLLWMNGKYVIHIKRLSSKTLSFAIHKNINFCFQRVNLYISEEE